MAINRNVIVAIPAGAYVEKDATVFVKDKNEYDPEKHYNRVKHTIIGRSIGGGRMYPNHNFRQRYPALYEEAAGEKLPKQTKKLGFYTTVLSLAERTSLYDTLIRSYGIENANMVMDFSMYSIIHHSCVAENYPSAMEDQILFSSNIWNQSKLSKFFNEELSEERTSTFRKLWAQTCTDKDIKEAWIAIDGSNNDCDAKKAEIAEQGKAKSRGNGPIVSYMYAIDSRNGDPITFSIYRGGRVDCKAVIEMIGWLKAYDIKVAGVIIDRGFATKDVFTLLDQNGIAYVAMMKGDTLGHTTMVEQYGDKIRMQYEYMLGRYNEKDKHRSQRKEIRSDANVLYGTQEADKIRLFSTHTYEGYASVIYDSSNGGERQETWFKKVSNTAQKLQQKLDQGKDVAISKEYADCIHIEERDGEKIVWVNHKQVQERGNRKGFYTLASSLPLTADKANGIYTLRNSAEEQFSMVKSQLGYDTTKTHYSDGIKAKLTLAFIAAIIRNELVKACKESEVSTNRLIGELNQISMYMNGKEEYYVSHTENERQIKLMKACGVAPADLDEIAKAENKRLDSAEPDPYQRYPRHIENAEEPRKKVGRPKGSGNKIREKKEAVDKKAQEKRSVGRPKGAKNKKTLEQEAQLAVVEIKRKPGRPKGSPNKPKPTVEVPKRKRGRPRKDES
jgi:hypothetical protein